jgi:NAD(P)-dependent dehydrogenase (short-subunit alcohol dehydrogenase family)
MSKNSQVAIITGGASGIGFAVGEALSARNDWTIHLLDRDVAKGQAAANSMKAKFHEVDVANYASLATAFASIYAAHGRLSFVFANAGIAVDAKAQPGQVLPTAPNETPAAPSLDIVATNLHSVVFTTTLAQHYFRQCPSNLGPRSIVVTASCASFYASPISPMYCASKHGVLGWTRSVAPSAWRQDRVSINAICPGIVRTNILPDDMYAVSMTWSLCGMGARADRSNS